jgi:transposase
VFYDAGNRNGKISQRCYIDSILYPHVLLEIEKDPDIVLEEDGDSGHRPGKSNLVRQWKEQYRLKYYFNPPSSPDLSIIENCWQPVKQHVDSKPY